MKKIFGLTLMVLTAAIFTLSSCTKFEEGKFSVRTVKTRLCRNWNGSSIVYSNGSSISTTADYFTYSFSKEGTFTGKDLGISVSGDWTLNDDKTQLTLTQGSFSTVYTITKLTMEELSLKNSNGTKILYVAN